MEITTAIIIGVVVLMIFLFSGSPLGFAFGLAAVVVSILGGVSIQAGVSRGFDVLLSDPLLAIPFFILAGDLMKEGRLSTYLLDCAYFLLGRIPGTLGHVMILTMAFFGAITGSAAATVAAIGSFMIPKMVEEGYDVRYAATLAAFGGILGPIIPPSISLIIIGYLSNVSIGVLFLGSVIPGILLAISYMIVHHFYFPRWYAKSQIIDTKVVLGRGKFRDQIRVGRATFYAGIPALIMPVLILGSIFSGIATATEAGAVSAIYALFVGFFIYRGLKIKKLPRVLKESANTTAALFIIIAVVQGLNWVFLSAGLPEKLAHFAIAFSSNVYIILFLMMVIYLFLGCWFDPISILLIMVPLFNPLAKAIGLNLVHFGEFTNLVVCVAVVTPPMASNLFVAARLTGLRQDEMYSPLVPFFFFGILPVLIIIMFFPQVYLWLPIKIYGAAAVGGGWNM